MGVMLQLKTSIVSAEGSYEPGEVAMWPCSDDAARLVAAGLAEYMSDDQAAAVPRKRRSRTPKKTQLKKVK